MPRVETPVDKPPTKAPPRPDTPSVPMVYIGKDNNFYKYKDKENQWIRIDKTP